MVILRTMSLYRTISCYMVLSMVKWLFILIENVFLVVLYKTFLKMVLCITRNQFFCCYKLDIIIIVEPFLFFSDSSIWNQIQHILHQSEEWFHCETEKLLNENEKPLGMKVFSIWLMVLNRIIAFTKEPSFYRDIKEISFLIFLFYGI